MILNLHTGDCLEVMTTLPTNSVDAIVTDPPYGLSFMGKEWDHGVPGIDFWTEAHRVCKPGAHLLAFGGSRTYHRLASAIEDAGWEIRDQIMWVYGSGFPKSLDVSKAIDKAAGAEREIVGTKQNSFGRKPGGGDGWGEAIEGGAASDHVFAITVPATDAAKQWAGWGTALKPAHEPIVLARKRPVGTVAENVLEHGTGAVNVQGCRVGTEVLPEQRAGQSTIGTFERHDMVTTECTGRWPANVIHDGSEEVVSLFPDSKSNPFKSASTTGKRDSTYNQGEFDYSGKGYEDSGSAARFFYCAKASKADRNDGEIANNHPTVKPTDLMRYLCRLVTPPGGLILDPFMGSGSTGKAAALEGFNFTGIELSEEYTKIAEARIKAVMPKEETPAEGGTDEAGV